MKKRYVHTVSLYKDASTVSSYKETVRRYVLFLHMKKRYVCTVYSYEETVRIYLSSYEETIRTYRLFVRRNSTYRNGTYVPFLEMVRMYRFFVSLYEEMIRTYHLFIQRNFMQKQYIQTVRTYILLVLVGLTAGRPAIRRRF